MCKLKSVLILKDRVFCPDYDSHDEMLRELGIKDTRENAQRLFVRAEITPDNMNLLLPVAAWKYRVDQDIIPEWYVAEVDEARARKAVEEWANVHVLTDGYHELKSGTFYLYNSARATLYGSASATLYDAASAELYDAASAELYDAASAELYGSARAKLYGSASATLYGSARAKLCGSARATLYGSARAKLYGSASATLYGSATATLYGSARATLCGSARATLCDAASAELYDAASATLCDAASAELYDAASGIIPTYSSNNGEKVVLNDAAVLINHRDGIIKAWGKEIKR